MKLLRFTERTFCNLKLLLWRKFLIDDYFITKKIQYEVLSVRIYSLIGFTAVCTTSLYYTVLYFTSLYSTYTALLNTLFFFSPIIHCTAQGARKRMSRNFSHQYSEVYRDKKTMWLLKISLTGILFLNSWARYDYFS